MKIRSAGVEEILNSAQYDYRTGRLVGWRLWRLNVRVVHHIPLSGPRGSDCVEPGRGL